MIQLGILPYVCLQMCPSSLKDPKQGHAWLQVFSKIFKFHITCLV